MLRCEWAYNFVWWSCDQWTWMFLWAFGLTSGSWRVHFIGPFDPNIHPVGPEKRRICWNRDIKVGIRYILNYLVILFRILLI